MRRSSLALLLGALLAAAGCAGPGVRGPVRLREEPDVAPVTDETDVFDLWKELTPFDEKTGTRYLSPQTAPECPRIEVRDAMGQRMSVWPARQGSVTLIVFWSPGDPGGVTALRHANDLVNEYRGYRVEGVSIVQKTASGQTAPQPAPQRTELPTFYDDASMSALKRMAGKVGAEVKTALPATFITDRQGRLRFYRPGFSYLLNPNDPVGRVLRENAPRGETIRAYLQRILREG